MVRALRSGVVLAALVVTLAARGQATDSKVGQPAPKFDGIVGVDDKKHGSDDFKDAKVVVIVFTCNHCPVAKAYEDRLIALQKEYQSKGVQLLAINVNTIPEDRLDKMKERAEQKGFNYPYLYDPTQKTGQDFGAVVTPHVFVLDQNRKIAYAGAIDDNMNAEKVTTPYLRDAIDALLAGKEPAKQTVKPFGCGIRYE
jgi:peroxiredoxin